MRRIYGDSDRWCTGLVCQAYKEHDIPAILWTPHTPSTVWFWALRHRFDSCENYGMRWWYVVEICRTEKFAPRKCIPVKESLCLSCFSLGDDMFLSAAHYQQGSYRRGIRKFQYWFRLFVFLEMAFWRNQSVAFKRCIAVVHVSRLLFLLLQAPRQVLCFGTLWT